MHVKLRGLLAIMSVALGIVLAGAAAGCQRYTIEMAGDVKDADGKPVVGCRVELLVRRELLANWTSYLSREGITSPGGAFSFSVFAPSSSGYRLRVKHPGYQEWLLDASPRRFPNHVHVTLRRIGESLSVADQSGARTASLGKESPNKGMKLTSVERIGRSQLIPGVRPTVREQHEEAAPGMSTAPV